MRPAFSVILLTTLLGAGQGLFLALVTHQTYALLGVLSPRRREGPVRPGHRGGARAPRGGPRRLVLPPRPPRARLALGRDVAHVLAVARGDRAAGAHGHRSSSTARRTSPASIPCSRACPAAWRSTRAMAVGVAGAFLAFALFVCTAMIYACLKFLREWHSPLTVANYTLLGTASGFTAAAALAGAPRARRGDLLRRLGARVHRAGRALARRLARAQREAAAR